MRTSTNITSVLPANHTTSKRNASIHYDVKGSMLSHYYGSCINSFWPGRELDTSEDILLVSLNIFVAFLNLFSNILVILLIVKTRQYRNQSLRLTLLLSSADLCTAVVSQPLHVYFLYIQSDVCDLNFVLQMVFYFFPYFSVFTIAFIVYDRFARIAYLHKYEQHMTKKKFRFGIFMVFSATSVQVALITMATLSKDHRYGSIGVLPLSILTFIFEIFIYMKTIYLLNRYKKERKKRLKSSDSSLVKLASLYLLMIIIFFTPFLVINTIYGYTPYFSKWFHKVQYTWLMSQVVYVCNSFLNAIMFLRVNRKARSKIQLFFQSMMKTNLARAQSMEMSVMRNSPTTVEGSKIWRYPSESTDVNLRTTKI